MEAKVGFTGHIFCAGGFALEQWIFISVVPFHHPSEDLKLENAFEKQEENTNQTGELDCTYMNHGRPLQQRQSKANNGWA